MDRLFPVFENRKQAFASASYAYHNPPKERPLPKCPNCGEELAVDEMLYVVKGTDAVLGCAFCVVQYEAIDFGVL